jgi:hypothetical protein
MRVDQRFSMVSKGQKEQQVPSAANNYPHYNTVFCSTCKNSILHFDFKLRGLIEVERSAQEGCQFCFLLLQGIHGLLPGHEGLDGTLDFFRHRGWLEIKVFWKGASHYDSQRQRPKLEFLLPGVGCESPFVYIV